jgi:hypothetical protein
MMDKKPTMVVKMGKTTRGGSGLPKFMYVCDDGLEYDRADLARMAGVSLDGMFGRLNTCGMNNPLLLLPPAEYMAAKKAITRAKDRKYREEAMAERRRRRASIRNNAPPLSINTMDTDRTHNLKKLRPIGSWERTLQLRVDQDQYRGRD